MEAIIGMCGGLRGWVREIASGGRGENQAKALTDIHGTNKLFYIFIWRIEIIFALSRSLNSKYKNTFLTKTVDLYEIGKGK